MQPIAPRGTDGRAVSPDLHELEAVIDAAQQWGYGSFWSPESLIRRRWPAAGCWGHCLQRIAADQARHSVVLVLPHSQSVQLNEVLALRPRVGQRTLYPGRTRTGGPALLDFAVQGGGLLQRGRVVDETWRSSTGCCPRCNVRYEGRYQVHRRHHGARLASRGCPIPGPIWKRKLA